MNAQHILVDGYNAIFRLPGLRELGRRDLERAREELVRRLAEALSGSPSKVTVVFDGNQVEAGARGKRASRSGKVAVLFSAPGETADQRIQRLIEAGRSATKGGQANYRVVSSDRELAGRARLWGAEVVTCEAFMRDLGRAPSPRPERLEPPPSSDKEIAAWEELFRRQRADGEEEEPTNGV